MLNDSITINRLRLRNRIVMPPMASGRADHGRPDDAMAAYYAGFARATALLILEHEYVSFEGMAHATQLSMADDGVIPAYAKLTEAVHARGAAIFAQISHAGALARDTGEPPISPSGVSVWEKVPFAREMTVEDIARVRRCFAEAALRAKRAGFDGVEIHSAHGYLLNQFYSPLTNRRGDAYNGQTLQGRIRLHTGILRGVREAVGSDFAVAIRFGAYDYREGGSVKSDIPEACRAFEAAGADMIDVSGGLNSYVNPGDTRPGWFSELSALAKQGARVPVMLTGGILTGEDAERILESGAADLIGVGRAMLKNPDWAVEALEALGDRR